MAITPEHSIDEAELSSLRSLVEEEDDEMDRSLVEYLSALKAGAAELQNVDSLSSEGWDWAEDIEAWALEAAEFMAEQAEDMRRGAAALSLRPGEEAYVEALRKRAAASDARSADAGDVVAATRRVQEKDLRRLAAREEGVVVGVGHELGLGFLGYVAAETDSSMETGYVLTPEDMAAAARAEAAAVRKEQRMAKMAGRLRRGAAAFAERPGEEALAAALQRQAANADAARAAVEAFRASVRRCLDAGSCSSPPSGADAWRARI